MNKHSSRLPPSLGTFILKKIYGEERYEEVSGDFIEVYQQRMAKEGRFLASCKYMLDAILSVRNIDLKNKNSTITNNNMATIQNYFKMAFRVLQKHPSTSLINLFGLAVGMGVCLLIYQYIQYEMSYDQFHSNAENTYRLAVTSIRNGEEDGTRIHTSYAMGVSGEASIPEVDQYVRIHPQYGGAVVTNPENNEPYAEEDMLFVDRNFLDVFDFPMKLGHRESALEGKYDIVITERMAVKYFGARDPLGKTLKISGGWVQADFTVKGVLATLPSNSHLQFDFIMPIMTLLTENGQYKETDGWGWNNFVTYITLDQSADPAVVAEKYNQVILSEDTDVIQSNVEAKVGLQPILDVHLKSEFPGDPATNNGSIRDVQVFSIIAVFILIIAWVNYINLSTAQAINRAKEVGIRKSIGAFKNQLISQFLVESALINFIAAVLAVALAMLMLPILNDIIGKQLEFSVLEGLNFWIGFILIVFFGALLSGLYPAFVLSAFKPVSMLNARKKAGTNRFNLRRGLIVFQFLTSVLLISGTYLVYKQIIFMKNQELGIDMEKILVLNGPRVNVDRENVESKMQTFKSKATSHHSIAEACGSGSVPGKSYNWSTGLWKLGKTEDDSESGRIIFTDQDFTKTYDFQFLSGRGFTDMVTDESAVIINEEAVKVYDLGTPETAINQKIVIGGADTIQVIGVLKDFHWSSLKEAHTPYLFVRSRSTRYLSFKVDMSDVQGSIAHIEDSFNQTFPDNPFNFFFLDDDFNNQYQADLQFGNLFTAFSVLAIFISCLGLFGLVAFSANARIKEIGIRKALGASTGNLMLLLSREYMVLLLIANALAIPAVVYWGQAWLDGYAYKVNLNLELFVMPGLILVMVSLLTVGYKTYLAARSNPVNALKVE